MRIIGGGVPGDRQSIPLVTRKRSPIPNEQRQQRAPSAMDAARDLILSGHPNFRLRSLASNYNCMGLVFASRRTCVEPEHFELIAGDDGLSEVTVPSAPIPGDLAVYRDRKTRDIVHVGVIVSVEVDIQSAGWRLQVLSQFGADGEYLHRSSELPELLAQAYDIEFSVWSEAIKR